MSENNQEPTMEEILASIRRIISEDDTPAEGEGETAAAAAPRPAEEPMADIDTMAAFDMPQEPSASSDLDEDVLELTDRLDDPLDTGEALAMSDLEVLAPQQPMDSFDIGPLPTLGDDEPLVSAPQAAEAASAFDKLERSILMPAAGRTLEDVVREMLRPMMRAWLDEHLPAIVEAQVAAEVERISRQRR
jgi:cell pole-organizing protein PopZ